MKGWFIMEQEKDPQIEDVLQETDSEKQKEKYLNFNYLSYCLSL